MSYHESRPVCTCDTECYQDYWSVGFRAVEDGSTRVYELYPGHELNRKAIARIFREWCVVTFFGRDYDIPMIILAVEGATNSDLKAASDELILTGVKGWQFLKKRGIYIPDFIDNVDLTQVNPGAPQMPSLKLCAGRLHSKKMQELPIAIDESIDDFKREILRAYHNNDLEVTHDLFTELKAQIELRRLMSVEYGVDLRSKSDPQVAEAVVKAEIERVTGEKVYPPDISPGFFKFKVHPWMQFKTPELQELLEKIRETRFTINHAGLVDPPDTLKELDVRLGSSVYRMGLGGLHSQEKKVTYRRDDEYRLFDRDVTSYYPMSILLQGMYPRHLGSVFLSIYRKIYETRVAAKKNGEKNKAETLKIVLNGVFGKFGNPYSIFFAPELMVQVTLSGQLAILMLIERLELAGIRVRSGNTDGIVSQVRRDLRDAFKAVIMEWEWDTGYLTEEKEYRSTHSRDVNNYIAIDVDGKIKLKGAFAASGPGLDGAAGLKKNPDMDICTDAVIAYLQHGTPIEETIEWCTDVRKFLTVRRVRGGAEKDGQYLGKALRWYHSSKESGMFSTRGTGNKVPDTEGAKLMMELQPHLPSDIDYPYYIREAYAILQDLGVKAEDPRLRGRTKPFYARLPDAKNVHLVNPQSGIAACGKARLSIRDSWIDQEINADHKLCPQCKKRIANNTAWL